MCEQRLNQCFGTSSACTASACTASHPEVAHLTPACLGSKGKQREEGGIEYLGRNKAIGHAKMSQARQPRQNRVETDSSEICET